MELYSPKEDIKSFQGTILFDKKKEYKFNKRQTFDELGCIRSFTEKEMEKYFVNREDE